MSLYFISVHCFYCSINVSCFEKYSYCDWIKIELLIVNAVLSIYNKNTLKK